MTILSFIVQKEADAFNFPLTSQIKSESAIVINLDSELVIHEKNADVQQTPGPLVNIITAIVCLENCKDLSEEITINENVYSSLYDSEFYMDLCYGNIYDKDVLTIEDLLSAMMLTSSFEASQTLAYRFGDGNISSFVDMMNEKAKEIGCTSTNFTNPNGLYDPSQYTTARDMALITEYALKVPHFEEIATRTSHTPSHPNTERHVIYEGDDPWIWNHSNLMTDTDSEYYYNGVKGIKTANTSSTGRNLITLGSKNGHNYLVVLLKAPFENADGERVFYHLEDAETIFNWAFNHFAYQVLLSDSNEIDEIEVELGENADYVLVRPEKEFSYLWYDGIDLALIRPETHCPDTIKAPVEQGQILGTVDLKYSGETLGTVNLIAVSGVKRSKSKYNVYAASKFIDSPWLKNSIIICSVLCGIYILVCIYAFICYKNKLKPVKPIYAVPKKSNKTKSNNKNMTEKVNQSKSASKTQTNKKDNTKK
ncbi:MAG: D-alanyl-D-alanine carboxypeptidase [Oscillospiraceae bacterium]|nr:D-alanyl-D-alanine carboxypeptidase [Oscillospiraceae bacterium]